MESWADIMKYGKREYRLPKTENRQETEKAESGQVSWVLGLFLILFLAILLYMQLQPVSYTHLTLPTNSLV